MPFNYKIFICEIYITNSIQNHSLAVRGELNPNLSPNPKNKPINMIIKTADDKQPQMTALLNLLNHPAADATIKKSIEREIRIIKLEIKQNTLHIDHGAQHARKNQIGAKG
jgi:hypothetical protein